MTDRTKKYAAVDQNTRDSQGNLIEWGAAYSYKRGMTSYDVVYPAGPDVRGPGGWAFAWVPSEFDYEALVTESLTKIQETT